MTPTTIFGRRVKLTAEGDHGDSIDLTKLLKWHPTTDGFTIESQAVLEEFRRYELRSRPNYGTIFSTGGLSGLQPVHPNCRPSYPVRDESVIAEGLYPRGAWQAWVPHQDKVWVDFKGTVHRIDKMSRDYCLNVIQFLYENHHTAIRPERSNKLLKALRARVLDCDRA